MKNEIQTNLLGKMVQFTMGLPAAQIKSEITGKPPYWEHLGESGEIVAVYQDKDGELQAMVRLTGDLDNGGKMIERCVKYLRIH